MLAVLAAAGVAWALEVVRQLTAGHDHRLLDHPTPTVVADLAAGWTLMVVAMMLPPALPLLDLVRGLVQRRRRGRRLVALAAAVVVGLWLAVGAALLLADAGLHDLSHRVPALGAHPTLIPALGLAGTGAYQLSELKERCLRACRSPRGFALRHWQGRRPAWRETAALAGDYALSCLGCCWALMALLFAVGSGWLGLAAMVALSLLMAAERLAPWGLRLARPTGLAALAGGTGLLLATALPLLR
ncbi:MAG: DUF2182 domain-containing protein [Acidimicrobiales bacterium]